MVAPAVAEQQAKLGVSAEESKAERLKRQQARFRDRGGVFVPSTSNPLVDILLARTVSGESPSKPHTRNVAKRPSLSKPRRSSPTRKANAPEESQAVARSSKWKAAPRKGKAKVAQPEVDQDSKPAPKRRGRPAQSKKKAPDPDSDVEQQPPATTKSKRTSKGSGKQRVAPSTSEGHPKAKVYTKPAKEVAGDYDSDHDRTVDVPHKPKSHPKKIISHEGDDETNDDAPIIKKRAKVPGLDSDAEQPPLASTKSKRTPKANGKQQVTPSTSDGRPKPKPRPKVKTKPPKEVVEVLDSDHDQTVDVPRKPKSNPKKIIPHEDDDESDDAAPIIKKRAVPRADDSKASGAKAKRVKTNSAVDTGKSGKKIAGEKTEDEECPNIHTKKRLVSLDEEDDDLLAPPSEKGKALACTKSKSDIELEPPPCPAKNVRSGGILKATGKKGKGWAGPVHDAVELMETENDERPPEHVSEPKKRKKEEDNYDDRPRKVVKFSEPVSPHSHKLKENQADKKRERALKPRIQDELDALQPELADKPPACAKSKGPPRKVLARIKASAARHLCCNASEPDELDCLS